MQCKETNSLIHIESKKITECKNKATQHIKNLHSKTFKAFHKSE